MLLKEIQSYSDFELLANKAKEGFIAGLHKSPFRGFSVEFAEHRPYNAGESVKNIDWKLLARTDKKYIKQFDEETNLKAHIWLDTSGSMRFPEKMESKLKFGTLTSAVIGGLLQQQKTVSHWDFSMKMDSIKEVLAKVLGVISSSNWLLYRPFG